MSKEEMLRVLKLLSTIDGLTINVTLPDHIVDELLEVSELLSNKILGKEGEVCEHGRALDGYCFDCGRINNA